MIKTSIFLAFFVFLGIAPLHAKENEKDFKKWLEYFTHEARLHDISDKTLQQFKENAEFLPKVIRFDRNQPHSSTAFSDYLQKIVPQSRANRAKKKIQQNWALLDKIEKEYGVQKRFIVSLWAIESNFGTNMGSFNIPNSLATLSYEGRRAAFFKKELLLALKIIDKNHISYRKMKGSWAGAMGQTQFMPSSFFNFAVDYNKNGKIDIWNEREDVFASIANFLSKSGWKPDYTWGRSVTLPANFDKKLFGKETTKTLAQWDKLGVRKSNGKPLDTKHQIGASIVAVNDRHHFIIYDNYKTLLKWNRSLYFASAVGILSDKINR
jgi:membrane-bound lytic murein transglycosylase B